MQPDARSLAEFYEAPIGQIARRTILRRIKLLWPEAKGLRVLGYGFAAPYMRPWLAEAERVIAAMPAQQGVIAWPGSRNLSVLSDSDALPFPDAFFDRILIVHGLEGVDAVRPLMRQLWRVLAPEGRLLLAAPNRASLWAQVEYSPFAHGRPFHRAELAELLRQALFEPQHWDRALYIPPLKSRRFVGTGSTWERLGRRFWPALAGLHLVEASKSLVAAVPQPARRARDPVFVPARASSRVTVP